MVLDVTEGAKGEGVHPCAAAIADRRLHTRDRRRAVLHDPIEQARVGARAHREARTQHHVEHPAGHTRSGHTSAVTL